MTYAANFLQSEMFQLEHSTNSPTHFSTHRHTDIFHKKSTLRKLRVLDTIPMGKLTLYAPFFSSSFFFCSGVFGAGFAAGGGAGFAAGGGG